MSRADDALTAEHLRQLFEAVLDVDPDTPVAFVSQGKFEYVAEAEVKHPPEMGQETILFVGETQAGGEKS